MSPAEVQTNVWHESVSSQGWQQKIRNSIMRLRDLFPYTIAPILLQGDNHIRFFSGAIKLHAALQEDLPMDILAMRALSDGPLSSQQLSEKLSISLATSKRILRKLSDDHEVSIEKLGRNVVYKTTASRPGGYEAAH